MKFGTKMLSAVTAGLVLAASLASCSSGAATATPTPIPLPEGVPEDVILEAAGIAKDTPLITVDGAGVPAEELLYWVTYSADQYAQWGMTDLSMDMGSGQTLGSYYLDSAVENATLYQVVRNHAEELKMGWNEANEADYEAQLSQLKSSLAAQMGVGAASDGESASPDPEIAAKTDAEYVRFLAYMGLSENSFFHINEVSYLFQNLREGLYGTKGTEAPDGEKIDAAGVLHAKHILIKAVPVTDESGNVTDDGMASALEKANALYDEITVAEDPMTRFEELMNENSEDVDSSGNVNGGADGYTFGPGEMVTEFEEGTAALAVGEISQPIQSDYGYHIILRLDADNEAGQSKYADIKMNELVDQWMEEAKVERTEALDGLDVQAFYDTLAELRQTMTAAAEAEDAPGTEGATAAAFDPTPDAGGLTFNTTVDEIVEVLSVNLSGTDAPSPSTIEPIITEGEGTENLPAGNIYAYDIADGVDLYIKSVVSDGKIQYVQIMANKVDDNSFETLKTYMSALMEMFEPDDLVWEKIKASFEMEGLTPDGENFFYEDGSIANYLYSNQDGFIYFEISPLK